MEKEIKQDIKNSEQDMTFDERLFLDKFRSAMKVAERIKKELHVTLDIEDILKIAHSLYINHSKNIRMKSFSKQQY
jgi:hypothetical protein